MNGTESDVDCGGTVCAPCPELSNCVVGSDCASDYCIAGVCEYPTCEDGVLNGDETDVDCGGGTCPVCAAGMGCQTGADCDSGRCTDGVCEAS